MQVRAQGDVKVSGECQKEKFNGRCCCNCVFHIRDYYHCTTAWHLREPFGGCVCGIPKGWICAPSESERVHSGWSEHGLCECHMLKDDGELSTATAEEVKVDVDP